MDDEKAQAAAAQVAEACEKLDEMAAAYRRGDRHALAVLGEHLQPDNIKTAWPALDAGRRADTIKAFLAVDPHPSRNLGSFLRDPLTRPVRPDDSAGGDEQGTESEVEWFFADGDPARAGVLAAGDQFTVYRGTDSHEANRGVYGISWTLDRAVAQRFADRFGAAGVVLQATVWYCAVAGALWARDEKELVIAFAVGDRRVTAAAVEPAKR